MINTGKLAGRTIFITGGSRGIGKTIALKAARDGANIVVAAKTAEPHPKLPGTIYTTCEEVEKLGGKCLPCVVDVRDEQAVKNAVQQAVDKFGGIDIVINNASAISLTGTEETEMKRYDLMHNVNTRGTFLVSKMCLPFLKKSSHAHILNISPPLNMSPRWFANHVAYTMAKYGMSMCVLGMAEEFRPMGIAVNALWPRTAIHTAAMEMLAGSSDTSFRVSRKPEIMADAAYAILSKPPQAAGSGQFLIDEDVLRENGVTDMDQYACDPSNKDNLLLDFYVDGPSPSIPIGGKAAAANAPVTGASEANSGDKGSDIPKLFESIKKHISPELVNKTQAAFQFILTGKDEGRWFIDLSSGDGSSGPGDCPSTPDATLTMDSNNFQQMFKGKLKPATAYMTGRIKIQGNMQKAMKLEKLMGALKSKL